MTFNSLTAIIDDLMLTIRNSNISESEKISRIQVEQWIHQYRAMLIKQDLDKGREIDPSYVQTISPFHLSRVSNGIGGYSYESDEKLPKFIDLHYSTGLIAVKDMEGNLIQIGTETKARYQTSRKYTCNDYIAYVKGNHLFLNGPGDLEYVQIEGILENPLDACSCFDRDDSAYPIPVNMLPTLRELILTKELSIMIQSPTDTTNNAANDVKQ